MPIEVRELIVRATVGSNKPKEGVPVDMEATKKAVKSAKRMIEQWTDSVKRQQER